jgi:NADH-quinone oxidoreductase subunit L
MTLTPLQLFLPLAGFVILGLGARVLPRGAVAVIGCGTVLASFVTAVIEFFWVHDQARPTDLVLWRWVQSGSLTINLGVLSDHLSSVMMLVVTGVGFLILVYSVGSMEHDPGFKRFFCYMDFFVFAMSLLVLADSFLFLLVGWAGVGLASFLLIGFWFHRPAAVAAAQKAFILNVLGDFGLLLAIFLLAGKLGTLQYTAVLIPAHFRASDQTTTAIALLLLVAAAAKSAQLPLHLWLPDAMEGPTPVSALIHAATMVTAGVYLVARCHVLFQAAPLALVVVAVMGGASALVAATSALFQRDIKRVLAYSTMSQLGYMFVGESVGANTAAIFHLTTHAFFKALLFMAAGGVIHALGGEQDLRRMGGLRTKLPVTFWSFVVGGLALVGIPPLAGFWSKDAILGAVLAKATEAGASPWYLVLWGAGVLTAILTGLYTFRLIFSVFFGSYRGENQAEFAHAHEVGASMAVPMGILLGLAVIGGLEGTPLSDGIGAFLAPAVGAPFGLSDGGTIALSLGIGTLAGLLGIALAWVRYGARPATFTPSRNPIYLLLSHAYYLDQIGDAVIVKPVLALGRGVNVALESIALGGGSQGIAWLVGKISEGVRRLQTGYARNYALVILLGAVAIIVYIIIRPLTP